MSQYKLLVAGEVYLQKLNIDDSRWGGVMARDAEEWDIDPNKSIITRVLDRKNNPINLTLEKSWFENLDANPYQEQDENPNTDDTDTSDDDRLVNDPE